MQQAKHAVKHTIAQAKQGDPRALEQLMGGPLRRKGIEVSVERKGALLFISLAGEQCPPKQGSLAFIQQGIEKLGVEGIESLRVSGYRTEDINPIWVERLPLKALRQAEHKTDAQSSGTQANAASARRSAGLYKPQSAPKAKSFNWKMALVISIPLLLAMLVGWLTVQVLRTYPANSPETSPTSSGPVEGGHSGAIALESR